ncbi:MAG: tetratricopeptide repeat protein, partial [Candidatus Delongbacteria bacterium]|nr:tetratricopeptide repeat protein [Candidatus Delongbacteria bacterium]
GLNALMFFEEINNEYEVANCCTNIGCLFLEIGEYDKSIKYLNKALKLFIEHEDTDGQSICLSNIGTAFASLEKYDEAMKNYKKALEFDLRNHDLFGSSASYQNIGEVYRKLKKYKKAYGYFNKALEIKEQIGDKKGTGICYLNIAHLKREQANYVLAEEYCIKSLLIFKQINDLNNERRALEELADIYYLAGKYEKAYTVSTESSNLKDSLFNIEKAKKIAQLEEKYLNEKKDKQIQALEYENNIKTIKISNQKQLYVIYLIAFILSVIAIIIILIQLRIKNGAYKFLVKKNLDLFSKERELKIFKRKITITDNIKEEILERLEQLLDNEKIYRDVDLTIDKLAKSMSTNRNYLSQTIYKEFGKNYNDFINEYRIKEAMFMLSDPITYKKYSIEAIAKESGFNTKSNFNRIFKNYTGVTPSVFNRENTLKSK